MEWKRLSLCVCVCVCEFEVVFVPNERRKCWSLEAPKAEAAEHDVTYEIDFFLYGKTVRRELDHIYRQMPRRWTVLDHTVLYGSIWFRIWFCTGGL